MRPCSLRTRAAPAASLSTTKVASTWTLAAVMASVIVEGGTPAKLARPALKPSWSKVSTVPATVISHCTVGCVNSPGVSGGSGGGGEGPGGGGVGGGGAGRGGGGAGGGGVGGGGVGGGGTGGGGNGGGGDGVGGGGE